MYLVDKSTTRLANYMACFLSKSIQNIKIVI